MAYERQKAIQRELDARIPRGLRGGLQNAFRGAVSILLSKGLSFDESVARAVAAARKQNPNFAPEILPPSAD